ncbi:TraB/GumN family protein [Candidatus Laterigemmans baculatus]|uniref:TraB/GumN family protein n=1 Tax=Candidatus Laterigemmans baculatus TaxID=2770505 RepID=UPI0013DB9FC4|nr:TraB/GumN family protein [Candidatus Laterigemmans baculatus]
MRSLLWFCLLLMVVVAAIFQRTPLGAAVAAPPVPDAAAEPPAAKEAAAKKAAAKEAGESGAEEASRYIRISKTEGGLPKALETSIVRYVGGKQSSHPGVVVDLVGVVHVGQKEYYRQLDKRLKTYDVVLYELVAPNGTRVAPEEVAASRSPLGAVQLGMRDMLNLEFQLQHIDYSAKNFRHADMSPDEFLADMEDRGDSILKMGLRMMGAGLATQAASGSDAGMLRALLSGEDRPKKMKQVMAQQLIDMEAMTAGLDDAAGENTLIRGRNARAFEVLKEEIEAGKKRIAVFYGAGHLPDMAERLEQDFQLRPTTVEWFPAWNLQKN